MVGRERLHQLQVGVSKIQVREPDRSAIHHLAVQQRQADSIPPDCKGCIGVGYDDGDVIESSERNIHFQPLLI